MSDEPQMTRFERERLAEIELGMRKGKELEERAAAHSAVRDQADAEAPPTLHVEFDAPVPQKVDAVGEPPPAEGDIPSFTEEELREVGDKHGIKGLRAIGDRHGVKGTAKEELIREILTAQLVKQAMA